MEESPLNNALRQFEAAEANLSKLERLWSEIQGLMPKSFASFGDNPSYEDKCRSFYSILECLPKIDGWKPEIYIMEMNEIVQGRFDAQETYELDSIIAIEEEINQPGRLLREYRYLFNKKRGELIRDAAYEHIKLVDEDLSNIKKEINEDAKMSEPIMSTHFETLKTHIAQIDTLLGSSITRPKRWNDLYRHLHFGQISDFNDIVNFDWPQIKTGLQQNLYSDDEPLPIEIEDLSAITRAKPKGSVATKLLWEKLDDEGFERLIFSLISHEEGYENPQWLTRTNAPDRGRDLSVYRKFTDPLTGVIRQRVILQCKHWLNKSISVSDISELREQMKLWQPPLIDVHIIASSGRFTSDAIALIEKYNQSDTALKIEMWPESHLERLLASRPAIIAEFGLR